MNSVFEAIMLICFGAAWPLSLYKSWKSGQTGGKSVFFLIVIFVGYLSGVIHKLMYARDAIIFLYVCNGLMVAADIALFMRNRNCEKVRAAAAGD